MPKAKVESDIEYEPGRVEKLLEERLKIYNLELSPACIDPFSIWRLYREGNIYMSYRRMIKEFREKKITYSRDMYFNSKNFYSFLKDLENGKVSWKTLEDREFLSFEVVYLLGRPSIGFVDIWHPVLNDVSEFGIFGDKTIFVKAFNKYYGKKILIDRKIKHEYRPLVTHSDFVPSARLVINSINDVAKESGLFKGKEQDEIKFEDYINMLADYFCIVPASKI